jgi:AmpD protein
MRVDVTTGLLVGVKQVLSPHFDARPAGVEPDLVILHGISLPPGVHPFFETLQGMRVSAHVLVRRDGEPLQFVSFNERAWHAGRSAWQGREACNDYSIGIECEGTDDSPYEDAQYETLRALLRVLSATYRGITGERVVGHCDVAPGRKTDPGAAFDWSRVR